MPHFCLMAEYTPAAMKAMVENPNDRSGAVSRTAESIGGRLVSLFTMVGGSQGILAIFDLPEVKYGPAITALANATGSFQNVRSFRLLTQAETVEMQRTAQQLMKVYPLPGT